MCTRCKVSISMTIITVLALASIASAVQTIDYTYDALGRLTSASYDGSWLLSYTYDASGNIVSIVSGPSGTGVDDVAPGLPREYALGPSNPNPFATATNLTFALPRESEVDLGVFDVSGRRVRSLTRGLQPAGFHTIRWDGRDDVGERVASGVYFYRFEAGAFVDTRKLVVMR